MSILLALIFLVVFILLWVLYSPIQLVIDSNNRDIQLSWKGIGDTHVYPKNNSLYLRYTIFGWSGEHDLISMMAQPKNKRKKKKNNGLKDNRLSPKSILSVLSTFKICRLQANIDTDHFSLNSYLFAFLPMVQQNNIDIKVNYLGINSFYCKIENRAYRILSKILLPNRKI